VERYLSHLAEGDINYDTRLFSSVLQGYDFTERFVRRAAQNG
jgi:hypothetical protein